MEEVKTESVDVNVAAPDNSVEPAVAAPAEVVAPKGLGELLSEDLRNHKALQNYDTVDSMAKSLLSAQEMVGKRVADLTPEELVALDSKFGKPESIEGYGFEADEAFKNTALEVGLNHNQAQKLWEKTTQGNEAAAKAKADALATSIDDAGRALEAEYGSQLEARVDLAKKAAQELGGEDLYKSVFESEAGIDPKMVKALSEAGKRIFDHESVGSNQVTKFGLTPSEALNEIALLKSDPEFQGAYAGRNDAARRAATAKLQKLYDVAYPG